MALFIGEYSHSMDAKGRVTIPAKLRENLGENFLVTKGFEGCLYVYPEEEWNRLREKLSALPLNDRKSRAVVRFFMGSAMADGMDKQGRVLLSSALKKHAGLEKDVVLVGALNRMEIWDRDRWISYNEEINANMDEIAEDMNNLGFVF